MAASRRQLYATAVTSTEPFPDEYIRALRRMTPAERLLVGCGLLRDAKRLKAAMLRAQHPDWPEERVARAVRNLFLHGHPDL
jgi:hypothetical protein